MNRLTRLWLTGTASLALLLPSQLHAQPNIGIGISHRNDSAQLCSAANIGLFTQTDHLRGVDIGLLTSTARKTMYGVQMAGITAAAGSMRGVQIAGISNIARKANGVQVAALTNACTTPMKGVQFSGITNIAMGVKRGVQLTGVANVCASTMRGVQVGMYNYADTLNGAPFACFHDYDHHPRGVQVGIINYSQDTVAHKIGLVNINPKTRIDVLLYPGTCTKTNAAVRFRNHSTYNMLGFGTHYMGLDKKFSGALFYRIGQYFMLNPRLSVSGDVGYYHIETFRQNDNSSPERLFSLQARMNMDYQIGKVVGAFCSFGYGDTRYYHHAHHYRTRLIFEAGISLRAKN